MAGPWVVTDYEHAIQLEVTPGTAPGAPVGGDMARFSTRSWFKRVLARHDRDEDSDNSASVVTTQPGRESCTWELEGNVYPSGNGSTPTAPDSDVAYEAAFGQKNTCTAHTTTAAGSVGTSLVLTPGGGATSGIPTTGRVLIAVDVDATNGYEVRRVISRATDTVTLNKAFTIDPATGRTVKVCAATYAPLKTALKSLHIYNWLNGDNFRQQAGGCVAKMYESGFDGSADVPILTHKFSGPGYQISTHPTTRPTPVVAGDTLAPSEAKVWIGATKYCLTNMKFTLDNSIALRESEFCNRFPTGLKRTENNGRYVGTLELTVLLTTAAEAFWDNADLLTAYAMDIQIGILPGSIYAICIPVWKPDAEPVEVEGEAAVTLKGRCYATAADDECFVAFL